eukprot:Selendium_serpulae@DN1276_c0_g1_i1.p2
MSSEYGTDDSDSEADQLPPSQRTVDVDQLPLPQRTVDVEVKPPARHVAIKETIRFSDFQKLVVELPQDVAFDVPLGTDKKACSFFLTVCPNAGGDVAAKTDAKYKGFSDYSYGFNYTANWLRIQLKCEKEDGRSPFSYSFKATTYAIERPIVAKKKTRRRYYIKGGFFDAPEVR